MKRAALLMLAVLMGEVTKADRATRRGSSMRTSALGSWCVFVVLVFLTLFTACTFVGAVVYQMPREIFTLGISTAAFAVFSKLALYEIRGGR